MARKLGSTFSNLNFEQPKPVRLFEHVVEQIKKLIQSGHLKPGDKLPTESELSELFNLGRSSVREALRALESRGLIQVRPGTGAVVAENALIYSSVSDALQSLLPRRETVIQLLQVRGALERFTAVQAATMIDQVQLAQLAELLVQQEDLTKHIDHINVGQLAQIDVEFHLTIAKVCRNDIVLEILSVLLPSFYQDNQAVVLLEEAPMLVQEHREILQALKNNDPICAEREMGHHIDRVISEVNKLQKVEE